MVLIAHSKTLIKSMCATSFVMLLLLTSGCATNNPQRSYVFEERNYSRAYEASNALIDQKQKNQKQSKNRLGFSSDQVGQKLSQAFKRWDGTPYQFGGSSSEGIDCSALMQQVFARQFDKKLPRTTREQVKKGKKISFSSLKPGDLVFFKIGFRRRHVGVYIGDNRFFHASSSQGVTISHLASGFWSKHKWQARRVL